jgi:molybdopterin converting factor small subunit
LKVSVKYFGAPMTKLGPTASQYHLPADATVAKLLELIAAELTEQERKLLTMTTCMVNGVMVKKEDPLQDGDEVYILFPLLGG